MTWVFVPYQGISDIRFGDSKDGVLTRMRATATERKTRSGGVRLEFGSSEPAFVFQEDRLTEMNLMHPLSQPLRYQHADLFAMAGSDVIGLLTAEGTPRRSSGGMLIFPASGIALFAFDGELSEQRTITIFGRSHAWAAET